MRQSSTKKLRMGNRNKNSKFITFIGLRDWTWSLLSINEAEQALEPGAGDGLLLKWLLDEKSWHPSNKNCGKNSRFLRSDSNKSRAKADAEEDRVNDTDDDNDNVDVDEFFQDLGSVWDGFQLCVKIFVLKILFKLFFLKFGQHIFQEAFFL